MDARIAEIIRDIEAESTLYLISAKADEIGEPWNDPALIARNQWFNLNIGLVIPN